jgi:hypothetical protein
MAAIVILTTAIIPMVGMFDAALQAVSTSGDYGVARACAGQKLEQLRSLPYETVSAGLPDGTCEPSGFRYAFHEEQRRVGAQTLPHDGCPRSNGKTKPTTFETLTGLLPRLKPHRRSLRQDQGSTSQGPSQDQGDFGRSDRAGTICGYLRGRPRLLRACRIPSYGSPTVKRAVRP